MKKIFMFFVIAILFCQTTYCAIDTVVRESNGQGVNRDDAIKNALYEAAAQVKGVKVSTKAKNTDVQLAPAGTVILTDNPDLKKIEVEGLVKTYEILNEKKIDDKTYEVALKVWVYDYQAPDQNNRFKLAIMPVGTLCREYQFGDVIPSGDVSNMLSHKISMVISETNKFAVLDREYVADFARNKDIALTDSNHSIEEQTKLGNSLGADYMIVGTISNVRLDVKKVFLKAIGSNTKEYKANFAFDYRLITASTRQIKFADSIRFSFETKDIKKLVKKWESDDLDYRELLDNIISKAANQVAQTIIDKVYPIRIAMIDENGKIIINQGGRRISKGLVLGVYNEGKEIIDPDTKESLGKLETLTALIKVDEVARNISYAELIKGEALNISEGSICRVENTITPISNGAKSEVKTTPQNGVKLPFDR